MTKRERERASESVCVESWGGGKGRVLQTATSSDRHDKGTASRHLQVHRRKGKKNYGEAQRLVSDA